MLRKTQDMLKKFQREHEVYVDAQDAKSYWMVTARPPKKGEEIHHTHRVKQYISGRDQEGNVLIIQNPEMNADFVTEQWGAMETFDDFVIKAMARILEDMEEYERGGEGCDTCG
jgi:hypothetical protein